MFQRPFYLYPHTAGYWLGGLMAVILVAIVIHLLWQRLLNDYRFWFLGTLLIAALLPVSALTEGTRYLDLPSAAVALIAAVLIAEHPGRSRSRPCEPSACPSQGAPSEPARWNPGP